jgi:hypothetical protein
MVDAEMEFESSIAVLEYLIEVTRLLMRVGDCSSSSGGV